MQKKFLRTSVLTLVMGLSLLTASHAMNPDDTWEGSKMPSRQQLLAAYKVESDSCYEHWKKLPRDINGNAITTTYSGATTDLEHERYQMGNVHKINPVTGIHAWGCRMCSKLDKAASAMIREKKLFDARDFVGDI